MPYPAHIGQRPLEVREAYAALEQYANDYGEVALLLLMHASIPETLRADLLDLIRVNFLPAQGTDRSLEADVLFAPITTSLGAGYYRIDPQVRWHCMALLRSRYRGDVRSRPLRVAELLWRYVDAVEKHSGGAIDPQLAEFLAIQRWVALAFISPDGAAHAFADALRQTASDPVAARVQLGGLAAAIEMPLAREQTLLAYARGMDALARGDDTAGARILGALGNDEIRVGKVVLRPPGELLAEAGIAPAGRMPEDSAGGARSETRADRPSCVVLISSGARTELETRESFDADHHFALIRAALEKAGMDAIRADDSLATDGEALYTLLLDANLVLADLSTSDPGVCFLLGVSLALRPSGTMLIAEDGSPDTALDAAPGMRTPYARIAPGDTDAEAKFAAMLRALIGGETGPLARSPFYLDSRLHPPRMRTTDDPFDADMAAPDSGICLILRNRTPDVEGGNSRGAVLDAATTIAEACASEAGLQVYRPDAMSSADATDALPDRLVDATLAIVDISNPQPDVMLQLGMRLGLHPAATIVMAASHTALPLVLSKLPVVRYPAEFDARAGDDLHKDLLTAIKRQISGQVRISPIYAALPNLRPPRLREVSKPERSDSPPRIFISYVNAYGRFARPLEHALLELGATVDWDMNLKSGDAWQETLTRMLDEADAVVSVAGRATQERPFPMEEIARALRLGKLLIPVFVEAVDGPPELIERKAANTDATGRVVYLDGLPDAAFEQLIATTARNIVEAVASDRSRRDAQRTTEDAPESGAGSPSNGRLTVRQPDPGTLQYLDTTVRSRMEWQVRYDPALLDSLLAQLPSATGSFDELALALAQLLLPQDRDPPQAGDSVHLTLDRAAAALPWEAILGPHDGKRQLPVAVTRSLDGLRPPKRPRSTSGHALLIGDPVSTQTLPDMPEGLPPLPGVRSELGAIYETLTAAGYTVMVSEHENADEIMKRLHAREFRILVILGRSVHEYALDDERIKRPTKRPMKHAPKAQAAEHRTSGFILSDGIFLTAAEIRKMREPPQLVFLNDRHMDSQTGRIGGIGQHGKTSTSMTAELLGMGVDCVLTPAWTVDDTASAYWSQRFFEDISRGATLKSASLSARIASSDHFPLQSAWAAFQVWGQPDFRLPPPMPSAQRNSAS
ncbi:MAG: CHAT domain-containing protein [Azoarcus sp. PHD]|nr:MAG: CHAT domain-containing protein [Azoarcus sp. PHD]